MTPSKVLPPGAVLPPLETGDAAEPAPTRSAARKGGRRSRRGSRRHAERWRLVNRFLDDDAGSMSRGAVLVWLALWRDTKADGMACASIGNLAGRIRGSRNTVCRALSSLESRGLVEVVRRGSVNGGATVYRVLEGA